MEVKKTLDITHSFNGQEYTEKGVEVTLIFDECYGCKHVKDFYIIDKNQKQHFFNVSGLSFSWYNLNKNKLEITWPSAWYDGLPEYQHKFFIELGLDKRFELHKRHPDFVKYVDDYSNIVRFYEVLNVFYTSSGKIDFLKVRGLDTIYGKESNDFRTNERNEIITISKVNEDDKLFVSNDKQSYFEIVKELDFEKYDYND